MISKDNIEQPGEKYSNYSQSTYTTAHIQPQIQNRPPQYPTNTKTTTHSPNQTARRGVQQVQHDLFHGILLRAGNVVVPAVLGDGVCHRDVLAGLLGPRADSVGRVGHDHVVVALGQRGAVE